MKESVTIVRKGEAYRGDFIKKLKELDYSLITPIVTLILLWIIIGIKNPRLLSFNGITRVAITAIPVLICSFGVSHVIRLGSIDLSIEGQVALSGVLVSYYVKNGMNQIDLGFWAIVIAVATTTLIGTLNGLIHTRVKIPSFITTFGVGSIATGISILIFRGNPIRIQSQAFRNISLGQFYSISNIIIITVILYLLLLYLQKKTLLGTYINAIGGDEKLAGMVGVPVEKYKVLAFTLAGFCYGIVGVLLASRLGSGMSSLGEGLLMYSIAGVVLGGTSILGGSGGVSRTVIGVFIITTLKTAMIIFRISPYYQDAAIGLVLITAVLFSVKRGILNIAK